MYCETYHCTMTEAACVIRQENAKSLSAAQKVNQNKPGAGDINCADCAQGKVVAAATDPAVVEFYRKEMAGIRKKGWGRRVNTARKETAMGAGGGKDSKDMKVPKGMKVCSHKECEHGGKPQPLKDFDNCKTATDGKQSNCKSCRRKWQRDAKRRIYQAAKEADQKQAVVPENASGKTAASETSDADQKNVDAYADIMIMPSQEKDALLAVLFDGNELTLQRLHWLAYDKRRTPRDQIFAMIEAATPEWDRNKSGKD